ncbi:MAG: LytTR family DNA-binding domain-containing protein [Bacteroidales bacterium]|jgi:two-component system LytT family response regulator|nr:LytTR family DNA-binding domain-containing protein [Bacteroidales bacterium]
MKNLSLVIIDDESSARDLLKNLLEDVVWINILDVAGSVEEALPIIKKHEPEVILLDIQMPRKDGFSLIEMLYKQSIQVEVIFITAYERYAIKAIKSSAFDYLLKPVKKKELLGSLEKVLEKVKTVKLEERFNRLLYQLSDHKKLKFKNRTGFSMVDADEILFCQADSNYSNLHLDSGKILTVSMNLGKVEELLPQDSFCRISRSLIVNIKYIKQVDRKSMTCNMVNESSHILTVSKKYMHKLESGCDKFFTN